MADDSNPKDDPKEPTAPTEDPLYKRELNIAASIPAVYANRFFVFGGSMVKISFLEVVPGSDSVTNPQTAVVMSLDDAAQLHGVLGNLLQQAREALAKPEENE